MLKAGGHLQFIHSTGSRSIISGHAVEYLFELVEMEEGVTLQDVFQVLLNNPRLLDIYRKVSARELLEEAFAGVAVLYSGEYDPDGVEYLELSGDCRFDPETRTFEPMHVLSLVGVGFSLRESLIRDPFDLAAGQRQRWILAGTSPGQWINCPLRFESSTEVWERYSQRERDKLDFGLPVLGQMIYSILHEFSFFGVGQRRMDVLNEIAAQSSGEEGFDDLLPE